MWRTKIMPGSNSHNSSYIHNNEKQVYREGSILSGFNFEGGSEKKKGNKGARDSESLMRGRLHNDRNCWVKSAEGKGENFAYQIGGKSGVAREALSLDARDTLARLVLTLVSVLPQSPSVIAAGGNRVDGGKN